MTAALPPTTGWLKWTSISKEFRCARCSSRRRPAGRRPMAASAADAMSYTYVEGGWTQLQVSTPAATPSWTAASSAARSRSPSRCTCSAATALFPRPTTGRQHRRVPHQEHHRPAGGRHRLSHAVYRPHGLHRGHRVDAHQQRSQVRRWRVQRNREGAHQCGRGSLGLRGKPSRATEAG